VAAQVAQIRPSAQGICGEYFAEMHAAAQAGDSEELARLVRLTQDKIADELQWGEDKAHSAIDPTYIPRCMRG
jgi:hypothetical protein